MSVTGYLALYTTLIGWQQYQNLWQLMVGTGLVFIPFIGIVLSSFIEPFESQEPKSAAVVSLRRLLIQIVGALLIIEFCCVPTVALNPKVLHFEPSCSQRALATPGHTGTTYDNVFKVPTGVKVPILWYLVMSVANGFTHAAIEGLSCQALDYQALQSQLALANIHNPSLKKQTLNFYNACYVPAYSHYLSGLNPKQANRFKQSAKQFGASDLGWLGAHAFLTTPGFYDKLYAPTPIPGFAFDSTRDSFEGQLPNHPRWGRPSCKRWWQSPQGLLTKLTHALAPNYLQTLQHLDNPWLTQASVRTLIQHSFDPGMSKSDDIPRGYESLNDETNPSEFSQIAASLGMVRHSLTYYPTFYLIINALPVVQALILMGLYALLALCIPFSRYRLHFIITGSFAIFAITFWSYLWQWVHRLHNLLLRALYPPQLTALPTWYNLLQGGSGQNQQLISFIIASLYIALPLLLLSLAAWAGFRVSQAISGAAGTLQQPSQQAGQQAGRISAGALSALTKVATTLAK